MERCLQSGKASGTARELRLRWPSPAGAEVLSLPAGCGQLAEVDQNAQVYATFRGKIRMTHGRGQCIPLSTFWPRWGHEHDIT